MSFDWTRPAGIDHESLGHQGLARPLDEKEKALAEAMMQIFASGEHDFAAVASLLNERKVSRPSGETGPWSPVVLEQELHRINTSLDEAYLRNGIGA